MATKVKQGVGDRAKLISVGKPPKVRPAPPVLTTMGPTLDREPVAATPPGADAGIEQIVHGLLSAVAPNLIQEAMGGQARPGTPPFIPQSVGAGAPAAAPAPPAAPAPAPAPIGADATATFPGQAAVQPIAPGPDAPPVDGPFPRPTVYAEDPLPGQLMPANAATMTTFQQAPEQAGEHSTEEEIARKMLWFQALGNLFGAGDYAAQVVPGMTTAAIQGQQARDERERLIGRQGQLDAQVAAKQAAEIAHQQAQDANAARETGIKERGQNLDEQKQTEAVRQFNEKIGLEKTQTEIKTEAERQTRRREYLDLIMKMTPEAQRVAHAGLKQSGLDKILDIYPAYDDKGQFVPTQAQNPNAPTREQILQKELEAQYDLLKRDPKLLLKGGQEQIIRRIAELQGELGIAPDDPKLNYIFANMDPAEARRLQIATRNAVTAARGQEETARANRARETNERARLSESQRHNQAIEGLRKQENEIRANLARPGGNPQTEYLRVSNYLQELQAQKAALSKGNYSPLDGSWIPPDPAQQKLLAPTLQWIDQQIQLYTGLANNLGSALGYPPVADFMTTYPQPAAPAQSKAPAKPAGTKPAAKPAPKTTGKPSAKPDSQKSVDELLKELGQVAG